jgi:hypothetical protein
MKTSHKSDELKKKKKGGVHKSGTYALYSELQYSPFVIYKQFSTFKEHGISRTWKC